VDAGHGGDGRVLLQVRVGLFVLAGLAAFGGLVYGLGRGAGLFERQYRLLTGWTQVGGLLEGATVRLAGVPVGHVSAIRLPAIGGARVQVELRVARRVQDRIRADSVARIETLGLLGDKIIDVTLGSPGAPPLGDGAELRSEEPLDVAHLVRQGTELVQGIADLSRDLRTALAGPRGTPAGGPLAETLQALRALAAEIQHGQGALHRLVYDRELGTAVGDAAGTLRRLGEAAARVDRLLADPAVAGLGGEAARTLAEAREAAARANRVLQAVEEGRGLLHALVYDEGQAVRALEALLQRAATLLDTVDRGEGVLGLLLRDPDASRVARRLVTAADGLARALARAQEEDSVLRLALDDRALAADLRDAARSFREVTGRLARGEGVLGGLTRPGGEDAVQAAAQGLRQLGRLAGELGEGNLGELLTDLRQAMASLRTITGRLEAGEGTLGGLLADPTVYENLAAFLEGAERSLLLRALIRAAVGRGASPAAPAGSPRP
jgi:phospholipid/cholesterol/gamma-HCH transport system substrate-binding protein